MLLGLLTIFWLELPNAIMTVQCRGQEIISLLILGRFGNEIVTTKTTSLGNFVNRPMVSYEYRNSLIHNIEYYSYISNVFFVINIKLYF